jgi:hypothetical protein
LRVAQAGGRILPEALQRGLPEPNLASISKVDEETFFQAVILSAAGLRLEKFKSSSKHVREV